MKTEDPTMLGPIETQMMASMLSYGVQFLDPLPEEARTILARFLVEDLRSALSNQAWEQAKMDKMLSGWFDRGRIYEILPLDALVPTAELNHSATLLFLDKTPSPMAEDAIKELHVQTSERFFEKHFYEESFCRLLWLWFQWGRSYQKGNEHPPTTPLS